MSHAYQSSKKTGSVGSYLRREDGLSQLLPTVIQIQRMDQACRQHLSSMFDQCCVLHIKGGVLTLGVPSASLATRLKQQLPSLQKKLLHDNFDINAIAIKIQQRSFEKPVDFVKQSVITDNALHALDQLEKNIAHETRNVALKEALSALLRRQRSQKSG